MRIPGRVDIRARADEHVPPTGSLPASRGLLLEAHVPEIRAAGIDRTRDAPAALRTEGAEVVHLLEQGRKVVRLGDRDLVPELEQALVVEGPALAAETSAPAAASRAR